MAHRLQTVYYQKIIPALLEKHNYTNKLQVPKLLKIVINRGIGDAAQNGKLLETSLQELKQISGQQGIVTRCNKSIAAFKLREGMPVGVFVTVRDDRMYSFLDRLIHLALPRIRDFQGLDTKSFDGHGNLTLGLEEQLMFPEIEYDKIQQVRGMDISLRTTAKTDQEALSLLTAFGMPFRV